MTKVLSFLGEHKRTEEIDKVVPKSRFSVMQTKEYQDDYAGDYGDVLSPKDRQDVNTYKVRRGKINGYLDELRPDTIDKIHKVLDKEKYFEKMAELHNANALIHGYDDIETLCPPA